jgi:hypothetical protein
MSLWDRYRDEVLRRFTDKAEREWWRNIWNSTRSGRIDTWDYQWVFACLVQNSLAIMLNRNLVKNIGFARSDATQTTGAGGWLSRLNAGEIQFPLAHPRTIARNIEADAFTWRVLWNSSHYWQRNALIRAIMVLRLEGLQGARLPLLEQLKRRRQQLLARLL